MITQVSNHHIFMDIACGLALWWESSAAEPLLLRQPPPKPFSKLEAPGRSTVFDLLLHLYFVKKQPSAQELA
jgi:hypothetical protein